MTSVDRKSFEGPLSKEGLQKIFLNRTYKGFLKNPFFVEALEKVLSLSIKVSSP